MAMEGFRREKRQLTPEPMVVRSKPMVQARIVEAGREGSPVGRTAALTCVSCCQSLLLATSFTDIFHCNLGGRNERTDLRIRGVLDEQLSL